MATWDVSDVVELLKTFGLSREVLIFVFRHNIDGATMDESVELLVKDFQLDDEDLEYQIINKWKDISSKALSPAQVLRAGSTQVEAPNKVASAPPQSTIPVDEKEENSADKVDPPPPVFTHLRTSAWSRSGKFSTTAEKETNITEKSDEDIEPTPPPAVFTHLRTSAWSRSVKFAPSEPEPELVAGNITVPNGEQAIEEDSFEDKQTNKPKEPNEATKPADVAIVVTAALDPFHFVNQVLSGLDDLPVVTSPIAEPAQTSAETVPSTIEQEDVQSPILPQEITADTTNKVEVQVAVQKKEDVGKAEADSEQNNEENVATNDFEEEDYPEENTSEVNKSPVGGASYATDDWEAELEEMHRHSVIETPARTITPTIVTNPPEVTDTIGFETEESIPDLSPRVAEHVHCDVDDLEDPELDAVIAKQTEEYIVRMSQKVVTTPARSSAPPVTHVPSAPVSVDSTSKHIIDAAIVAKYEQEMKKQAELLRLQQEQIQLQRQLIDQQRRDLSESAQQRKVHNAKHSSNGSSHKKGSKQSTGKKSINDTFVPVRAALNYDLSGRTESPDRSAYNGTNGGASSRFGDNFDPFYAQQALVSMPHDSISMLSDSGIFDMYQSNFPFPGVFLPESSITSQNSGDYEAYRKQNDISPPPGVLKQQISKLTSDGGYEEQPNEPQRPYPSSYSSNNAQHQDTRRQGEQRQQQQAAIPHDTHGNRQVNAPRHPDPRDFDVDRDQHDRPLPDHFPRASPRSHHHGVYDHTQLTEASTDSAGHVWHHTHTKKTPKDRYSAPRAPVPMLNLNIASEQTNSSQTLSIQVPETSSPVSPRPQQTDYDDLVQMLKHLASTNIALTQALRPVLVPQEMGSMVPFTSRSAPVTSQTDNRGRHILTEPTTGRTDTTNNNADPRYEENYQPERPLWNGHTNDAAVALPSARSAPQGRPQSRASSSFTGARNSRGGARRRNKSDMRAQPAPKPVLQDYIDLLAQQFAARPLCQTPYFTHFTANSAGVANSDPREISQYLHQPVSAHQNHNIFAALDQERSFFHPYPYSQTAASTPQHVPQNSDLPRMHPFSAPASPNRKPKGGIILLRKSPTKLVYEGPTYAAPIERKDKTANIQEPSPRMATSPGKVRSTSPHYAAPIERKVKPVDSAGLSSPGRGGPKFGPGRVVTRPNTASDGVHNNIPFTSAPIERAIDKVDPSSKNIVTAAPPNTVRPSTTGSSGRNKARVLVAATTHTT
eukprot:gene12304-14243_t